MKLKSIAIAALCFSASEARRHHPKSNSLLSTSYDGVMNDLAHIAVSKDINDVINLARAEAKKEFDKQEDLATSMDQKRWRDTEFRYVREALLKTMKNDTDHKFELTKDRSTQVSALLSYFDLVLGYDKENQDNAV